MSIIDGITGERFDNLFKSTKFCTPDLQIIFTSFRVRTISRRDKKHRDTFRLLQPSQTALLPPSLMLL